MTPTFHALRRSLAGTVLATLALAAFAPVATAGKAHQHGVARLDVSLEGQSLSLELESPLDDLIGFERAPRTDAERQRVQAAADRLRQAGALFQPDADAQCVAGPVVLHAPVVGLGEKAAAAPGQRADHADLHARFVFECARPQALQQVKVGLFQAFTSLKRIETQVASPRGQARRVLTPASASLQLPR